MLARDTVHLLNILLIDHQTEEGLHPLSEKNGFYKATAVSSLDQALRQLSLAEFDLIVLEPFCCELKGNGAFEMLQRHAPETPILLLVERKDVARAIATTRISPEHCLVKERSSTTILFHVAQSLVRTKHLKEHLNDLEEAAKMLDQAGVEIKESYKRGKPSSGFGSRLGKMSEVEPRGDEQAEKHTGGMAVDDISCEINRVASEALTAAMAAAINEEPEVLGITSLIREAVYKMMPLAKEKHQRIIGELLEKMPIMSVKRKAFLGAVENLIMQALELAPQATTVSLFGRYDGKILFLRLITEGPGMPDEDVIEIFDRTWCTEPNRRYTARTALGLYTNKKLTSIIGATIECISSPMQGATVEMTLPVVPVALENGEYLEEQI